MIRESVPDPLLQSSRPVAPLSVLVCEDDPTCAHYVCSVIESCGATSACVSSGEEAIDAAHGCVWDLILMDVGLPGIDGIAATRRIKQIAREAGQWVPLVLFTSKEHVSLLVDGLQAGADDVLPKSINGTLLAAKLRGILALSRQARLLGERTRDLRAYRDAAERDRAFGRHVLNALTRRDHVGDAALFTWQREAEGLSGDLIAHHKTGDARYLLLADAMGHGMSAALVTILVADLFYAMAAKALPIADIAGELNKKLHRTLPPGNFVCAALVRAQGDAVEAINAGLPPCLLVRGASAVADLVSASLPFGIEGDAWSAAVSRLDVIAGDRLLLMSDGIHESPVALAALIDAAVRGTAGDLLDGVDQFADDATFVSLSL